MWTHDAILYPVLFFSIFLSSCATFSSHSKSNPESPSSVTAGWSVDRLLHLTCEAGQGVKQVDGSIWLKTQSKDIHGQFSASVLAKAPDDLKLEITNFLGGTVALISVSQGHYEITQGPSEPVTASGDDSWGGIPLKWANALFLGSIPCPSLTHHLILIKEEANQLTVEAPEDPLGAQKFSFKYKKIDVAGTPAEGRGAGGGGGGGGGNKAGTGNKASRPWAESLHWERLSEPKTAIDFKFDKPDPATLSPLQWEASSSEGAIKIRWKDRHILSENREKQSKRLR